VAPNGGEGSLTLRIFEATSPEHSDQADIDTGSVATPLVAWSRDSLLGPPGRFSSNKLEEIRQVLVQV
jgi:hypothetical protein